MLSQHRHPRSYGYWAEKRWSAGEDAKAGELALNPEYLKSRPVNDTLAVLVHEQCHVWQTYHGEAPAGPYHNKQWADKMEAVGLMPTSTNLPGGKRTGAHMGHYIIEGGPFDLACKRLLADGFALTWGASMERKAERGETKSGKRNKYVCPDCEAKGVGEGRNATKVRRMRSYDGGGLNGNCSLDSAWVIRRGGRAGDIQPRLAVVDRLHMQARHKRLYANLSDAAEREERG